MWLVSQTTVQHEFINFIVIKRAATWKWWSTKVKFQLINFLVRSRYRIMNVNGFKMICLRTFHFIEDILKNHGSVSDDVLSFFWRFRENHMQLETLSSPPLHLNRFAEKDIWHYSKSQTCPQLLSNEWMRFFWPASVRRLRKNDNDMWPRSRSLGSYLFSRIQEF